MKKLATIVLVCAGLCGRQVAAREPRDRAWLIRYVTQPIPQGARTRNYIALINRQVDEAYLGLDLGFLTNGGGNESRNQTNTIGRLAFCYRTPGLKGYRDPRLLEKLRLAYLAAAKHINAEGLIEWPGDQPYSYIYYSHEQGWRLEPLLLGYIWVGENFPAQDRETILAALQRSAEWMFRNPYPQRNNRGAVWCAVLTLAGLYFENPEYLQQVELQALHVMDGVVLEDGEVGEHTLQYGGGGPDSNYSYTGWAYVYLYRLLSGHDDMDAKLLRAMRWFSLYNTLSACPVVTGASVRMRYSNPGNLPDILPALEYFSRREPFLASVAGRVLAKSERFLEPFGGHTVSPLIWALWAGAAKSEPAPPPDWFVNHTGIYSRPEVQYSLVSRSYQTGIVFRGRTTVHVFPLRGIQSFALHGEYPILLESDHADSSIRADGIDTAVTNVDRGPAGWESTLALGPHLPRWRSQLAVMTDRRGTLVGLYAFTPAAAVAVYLAAHGPIDARWVMNRQFISEPALHGNSVSFADRKGRIHFLAGEANLADEHPENDQVTVLRVHAASSTAAFAFADDAFRFEAYDEARCRLRFCDASGHYELSLERLTNPDGSLNRQATFRLTRSGD